MIDIVEIKIKAGDGGDGAATFRREKFIPKGGPDGGDGGNGGDVILIADQNMATLADFKSKPRYEATPGGKGMNRKKYGANGPDLFIKVPVGTLVYEFDSSGANEILVGDMVEHGQTLLIAKGGEGGVGNFKFRSSTNQAPRQFVPGKPGEEKNIKLELKLIADIGLVGTPNAGKSTLINRLTHAGAKVASYPFTTLSPNLGVCKLPSGQDVIFADIPGLIEGASEGKGLGDTFLRHIERTRILVHLVDPTGGIADSDSIDKSTQTAGDILATYALSQYDMIRKELDNYSSVLVTKPCIVAINKCDITEISQAREALAKVFAARKIPVVFISAVTGEGMETLLTLVTKVLETAPKQVVFETANVVKKFNVRNLPNKRYVFENNTVNSL